MIGIDTNVVVRLLLRDNEPMFQRAAALVSRTSPDDPLIVNAVVVAESLWVLERRAGVDRRLARATLAGLLESEEMRVHEMNPFRSWADTLASEHRDYSDLVIASINREIGCDFTYTLDEAAAKAVPGMELLA
ncbi:MAG: PIN domain-containing protein [Rhizobiaceae bacterium]